MPFFKRTEKEIVSNGLRSLSQNTGITQLSPGAKARFFVETFAREHGLQHERINDNLLQAFIAYADTKFLDYFGDMMNLPRREASHASTIDNNFMWYVDSGTFGDINGGSSFSIPAGRIISSVPFEGEIITPGIEQQPIIEYSTTSTITCQAGQSFVFAPIRAEVEGSLSNVPKNILNKHDYQNYSLSPNNLLKCTNRYAISTGDDRESNDSYRFRLSNIFRGRQMAIQSAIRLAALVVPGVSDVTMIPSEQGPGTFSVYVAGLTPIPSPQLLRFVFASISQVTGFGNRVFVLAPEPIGVEFVASVSWSPSATADQRARGYASMREALENRIGDIRQGESFVFSDAIDTLLSGGRPYINSIGNKRANKFEEVYAYRTDPSTSGVVRSFVVGTEISPLYNEKVILETSGRHRGIQFLTQ